MGLHELLEDKLKLDNVGGLAGENIMMSCPYAHETHESGSDSKPSFGVHQEKLLFHCFTCNKSGYIDQLVEYVLRVDIREAFEICYEYVENYKSVFNVEYNFLDSSVPIPLHIFPDYYYAPFEGKIPKYLLSRGISIETAKMYDLGHDSKHKRLTFPLRNANGSLLGITGRLYKGWGPKYFNYCEFDKNRSLFGEDVAWRNRQLNEPVYVVEGPMDVVKLGEAGFPMSVAVMGSEVSQEQLNRIFRISPIVVAFLDQDKAGAKGIKNLIYKSETPIYTLIERGTKKDAGDMTVEELKRYCKQENFRANMSLRKHVRYH